MLFWQRSDPSRAARGADAAFRNHGPGQAFSISLSRNRFSIALSRIDSMTTKPAVDEQKASTIERDLMNRALAGDALAYGGLFELHRERIYRMAYAMLHDSDAGEDCVQATFANGLANLSSYRGESEPKAWFTAIALNLCRHRVRDWKHAPGAAADHALES